MISYAASGRSQSSTRPEFGLPWGDALALFLLPVLINLSSFPKLPVSRSMVAGIFILLALKNLFAYSAISHRWAKRVNVEFFGLLSRGRAILIPLACFQLLYVIAEIRGGYVGTVAPLSYIGFSLWSFAIFVYFLSVFSLQTSGQAHRLLLSALVAGTGFYVLINVAGHVAGLHGLSTLEGSGPNKTLSMLGISYYRIAFPFANGLNNFGTMSGLAIVAGTGLFVAQNGGVAKLTAVITLLLGFVGVVLGDSRAAFAISILVSVAVLLAARTPRILRTIWFLPYLVLVLPIVLIGVAAAAESSGLYSYVVREGQFAQRLGALTGRDQVWQAAYRILAHPDPMHVIGYGAVGQFTSGATMEYAWVFNLYSGMTQHSLHNAVLQVIFDIGYIGLVAWLVFWARTLSTIGRAAASTHGRAFNVVAGVLVYVLLTGVLEVSGTALFPDVFAIVVAICIFASSIQIEREVQAKRARQSLRGA